MYKIFIILLLITVQSCSEGYKKERDFRLGIKSFDATKSIVIMKTSASYEKQDGKAFDSNFTEMNWCKKEEEKKCLEIFYQSPYVIKKFYGQHNYYSINPGYYYLNEIKQQKNHPEHLLLFPFLIYSGGVDSNLKPNFNNSLSGWNKKLKSPNFASFETNAEEIVYIGDLYFTFTKQKYWIRGKIKLYVEDNYSDAVKYFYEEHPEFKGKKVVKRLVQPGVLLDNYDAGIFW